VCQRLDRAFADCCISSTTHSIASAVVRNVPAAPAASSWSDAAVASASVSQLLHTPSTCAMPAPTADRTPATLSSNATVCLPSLPTSSSYAYNHGCTQSLATERCPNAMVGCEATHNRVRWPGLLHECTGSDPASSARCQCLLAQSAFEIRHPLSLPLGSHSQ
jgi:hypothetical protein